MVDQRVDVEVVESLHQGEEAEDHRGDRDGGQADTPAQAVLQTGGGGCLGPGEGQVAPQYEVDDQDDLHGSLQTARHGLHLVGSQLVPLVLLHLGLGVFGANDEEDVEESRDEREEEDSKYDGGPDNNLGGPGLVTEADGARHCQTVRGLSIEGFNYHLFIKLDIIVNKVMIGSICGIRYLIELYIIECHMGGWLAGMPAIGNTKQQQRQSFYYFFFFTFFGGANAMNNN